MKVLKSRGWLVVAVIISLFFMGVLANPSLDFTTIPIEQVIVAIEEGNITDVVVKNETTVVATFADGTVVRAKKPAAMDLLAEVNIPDDMGRALLYRQEFSPVPMIIRAGLLIILPLIFLLTLYMYYLSRLNAKKEKS